MSAEPLMRGDRIEYVGSPTPDLDTATVGWVTKVDADVVFAAWNGVGLRPVPLEAVRLLGPEVTRTVSRDANARMWALLGDELPPLCTGRPRDPYLNQGCHPDTVVRVWDQLGATLPCDCRGQAGGKPVLAHPGSDRIFAAAHGTAYALWLTPDDFEAASQAGASTIMTWSGGSSTDLAELAGPGWIWGRWYEQEPQWVHNAYAAAAAGTGTSTRPD